MIGLLQDVARDDGGANRPGLRLGFVPKGEDWAPICSADSQGNTRCLFVATALSQWHLRANGKEAGTIATQGWFDPSLIAAAGLLRVTGSAPFQGKASHRFAGWLDKPVHPPLVALSAALPAQSPRWRKTDADAGIARAMLPILAKARPLVPDCSSGEPAQGKGRALAVDDVRITEAWTSAGGEHLYAASLKPDRVKACDYTADLLADVWAYDDGHAPLRAIAALSENETTHVLVDAGDFAGDGKEEFLFYLSGYNEDGLVLVYDRFSRSARFSWQYQ